MRRMASTRQKLSCPLACPDSPGRSSAAPSSPAAPCESRRGSQRHRGKCADQPALEKRARTSSHPAPRRPAPTCSPATESAAHSGNTGTAAKAQSRQQQGAQRQLPSRCTISPLPQIEPVALIHETHNQQQCPQSQEAQDPESLAQLAHGHNKLLPDRYGKQNQRLPSQERQPPRESQRQQNRAERHEERRVGELRVHPERIVLLPLPIPAHAPPVGMNLQRDRRKNQRIDQQSRDRCDDWPAQNRVAMFFRFGMRRKPRDNRESRNRHNVRREPLIENRRERSR